MRALFLAFCLPLFSCVAFQGSTVKAMEEASQNGYGVEPAPREVQKIYQRLALALDQPLEPLKLYVWGSPHLTSVPSPVVLNRDQHAIYIQRAHLRNVLVVRQSEELLAIQIAHEIGHEVRGRGLRQGLLYGWIPASAGSGAGVGLAIVWWAGLAAGGIVLAGVPLAVHELDRDWERDADAFAVRLTVRAGYDGGKAVALFCDLIIRGNEIDRAQGENPDSWWEDHPTGRERCQRMKEELADIEKR